MIIFENYNNAKMKYGEPLVNMMKKQGVSDEYLDVACYLYINENISINQILDVIYDWKMYIDNDMRKIQYLTFNEMIHIIFKAKQEALHPNQIYNDGKVFIGELKTSKDIKRFPIKNKWCISKDNNYFNKYKRQGDRLYLIDNFDESYYLRFIIMIIHKNGDLDFWDFDNQLIQKKYLPDLYHKLSENSLRFIDKLSKTIKYCNEEFNESYKNHINNMIINSIIYGINT